MISRRLQRGVQVLYTVGLVGPGLLILLLASATVNLGLRSRSILAVSERLERAGRGGELKWLTDAREELILATAIMRAMTSLVLVLVVVDLCERFELESVARNVAAFFLSFFLVLVFGVAVPAALAKYAAASVIATALPALRFLNVVSTPLVRSLEAIDGVVRRLAGVPPPSAESEADEVEREILNVASEGELQGAFDEREREMIESVIGFRDTSVDEIMTPRTDIVSISKDATLQEAKALIGREGHSRIPAYDGTIDNIIGVLYAKDLLPIGEDDDFDVAKVMRAVPYVPDGKLVGELLQELRDKKVHIAIVLDEYGGTSGLVTIEDIIEELVGEIEDEYEDPQPAPIQRIDETTVDVDARMPIDELNDELNLTLPESDDYETIGGFVFTEFGRIPRVGEQCTRANVEISITAAEPRRINRLRLRIHPEQRGASDDS